MAQNREIARKKNIAKAKLPPSILKKEKDKKPTDHNVKLTLALIAAAFGFLLYIGTVNYSYTLDDNSTITQNHIVQEGVGGIGTLLKTSYRAGYWESADELYRPLSLVMFAVEWNFFPNNPAIGHFVNVLLYALTGFLLFKLLCRLFKNNYLLSFIATLLFMAHPVHTEVVASIKSRDEILSFLLSIVSINMLLDYLQSHKGMKIILSALAFFLALMSKESALTLLAVIPLILYIFRDIPFGKGVKSIIPLIIVSIIFILIRAAVLKGVFHTKDINMLDNVLVSAPDLLSRAATAIYVLGRYLLLLLIPLHLSTDYSVNEITILKFADYRVLISLAVYACIIAYAVYKIIKKDVVAFGIFYYLLTISIVSNLFVIIGTVMADRLLYLPSLSICLIIAVLIGEIFKPGQGSSKFISLADFVKANGKPLALMILVVAFYSFKTIDRTPVWKNNYSLYSAAVLDAPNSARNHYLLGTELKNVIAKEETDSVKNLAINNQAMQEYKTAVKIYPAYFDAYNDIGKLYNIRGDTDKAIEYYDLALKYYPQLSQAMDLKGEILFGRHQIDEAMKLFEEAVKWDPRFATALRNLGSCYGMKGDYDNALIYLLRSAYFETDKTELPGTYHMIGMTYQYMGNNEKAARYLAMEKEGINAGK